eukprot:symbB.v1.2.007906.t1/scaffold491.1/size196728/10
MGVLLQRLGARPPSNKGSLPPRIPIGVGKGVPAPGLRAPPPLKGAGKGPGRGAGDVSPFQHKDIGKGKKGLQDARQGVFAKGKDGGKDAPFRHEKGGGVRGLLYSGYSKGATNGAVSRERDFANGTEKPSEEEPDSTIEGGDAKPPEAAVACGFCAGGVGGGGFDGGRGLWHTMGPKPTCGSIGMPCEPRWMATLRSASAGRRVKLHSGGSRRLLSDHSPYAAKVRPSRGNKPRPEKVKMRLGEPRSRSKGCQSVASSAPSAWTDVCSLESPKSGLYVQPARSLGRLNRLTPPHDPPSCWPWSPRNMNASVSQPSLCKVGDLKRSFHCKASQPHAWLFLQGAREKPSQDGTLGEKSLWRSSDFSFCPISGGCCVWKRVLKEDEVPNLHVQQAEESKESDFGRSVTEESLGSPSRKKNRLRPSVMKPKTSRGGSVEPMGPALEYAHGESEAWWARPKRDMW